MSPGQVENYVLLLVLLGVFAGGTLVLLSLLLLFCHRCCTGGRRYSRCEAASGTNARTDSASFSVFVFKLTLETRILSGPATTLRRPTPPTPKTLSPLKVGAALRFIQTLSVARRLGSIARLSQKSPFIWTSQTPSPPPAVTMESPSASSPPVTPAAESPSMNLRFMRRRRRLKATKCAGSVRWRDGICFCQALTATQAQSRPFLRYTLTEGDFHHLKKARLTHLHLPPAPCDLKILTIMECDSAGSSTTNISEATPPNLPVTICQVG